MYNKSYSDWAYGLRSKFNITPEDYYRMENDQNRMCRICKRHLSSLHKRFKHFHVDHCHKTGKVRGLLCGACNNALGLLKESKQTFIDAAKYLFQHEHGFD